MQWHVAAMLDFQDGHHPLLVSVSTSRLDILKNIGLDTKIMFLCLVQVISHQKLRFVVAMLNFQDGRQPFLISICTSTLGNLINIGLDTKILFVSAPQKKLWLHVYFPVFMAAILKICIYMQIRHLQTLSLHSQTP